MWRSSNRGGRANILEDVASSALFMSYSSPFVQNASRGFCCADRTLTNDRAERDRTLPRTRGRGEFPWSLTQNRSRHRPRKAKSGSQRD
jgi:hypothetical protein